MKGIDIPARDLADLDTHAFVERFTGQHDTPLGLEGG